MPSTSPPNPEMQSIDLSDFRQGIVTTRQSLVGDVPRPDGAAQPAKTWGCYALPDGGLAPLPAITFSETAGDPNIDPPDVTKADYHWPTVANGYPDGYDQRIVVLDAHIVSPVERVPSLTTAVDRAAHPAVDLFTARQWWLVKNDGKTMMVHRFRGHPVYSGNTGNTYAFKDLYSTSVDDTVTVVPSRWTYGWGSIMETRTQAESPIVDPDNGVSNAIIGPPVIVCGLGGMVTVGGLAEMDPEGQDTGEYLSYPDYHTGDTTDPLFPHPVLNDAVYVIPSPLDVAFPGQMFGHQGRMCSLARKSGYKVSRQDYYHGGHDGFRAATEILNYWPVNGIYNLPNGPTRAVFLEEATTGYGVVHSVDANTLLLVKNVGGAVEVSGDLDRPQVSRLPGIPPVGGLANRGVATEQDRTGGFIYGSTSGVWMWNGYNNAQSLSPNMDPLFWVPDDVTTPRREVEQLIGSFGYRWPFVFAPNNWVLDLRTNGWFRYYPTPDQAPQEGDAWANGDGAVFAFNEVDHAGNLWAVVASYELDGLFFVQFDQSTACNRWSWQSQPLRKARARFLQFRQVQVLATGTGRLTVTVSSPEANVADQVATFDLQVGEASLFQQPIGVTTTEVEVTVEAEGADGGPAPILHRVSLGYVEAASVPGGVR